MPLESRNLDDRTYKQIVREAIRLIPGYAPEWTDYNEHDPGMTIVELFSWMTELMLYRLNQVPDKNYIEFLKLIGIELKPAVPAKAHLSFTVSNPLSEPGSKSIFIPKGTRVEAESSGDEPPVVFETDETLNAVVAALEAVHVNDGHDFYDKTKENDEARTPYYAFGKNAYDGSALYLGFTDTLPEEEEVSIRVEMDEGGISAESMCCDPEKNGRPPVELVWEYWDDAWKKLVVIKDETRGFLKSGYVYFQGPVGFKKSHQGKLTEPRTEESERYWIRCRVDGTPYDRSPQLDMVLLNTIQATAAITVEGRVVGGSDGNPNQNFDLRDTNVLAKSLVLKVKEGNDFDWEEWKEVDDLEGCARKDKHFSFNAATGRITFGDGRHGKIPFAYDKGIIADYRYGGGDNTNVKFGTITSIQAAPVDVEKVTNRKDAEGGRDEESLKSAKDRAPGEIKTKDRAVTYEDFEVLAKQTPGARLARAKAIGLYHPKFSHELKVPGVVTVVIVPDSKGKMLLPSEAMKRDVCEHLNGRRLLTTELYVVPPKYRKVKIDASVVTDDRADLGEVKRKVLEDLHEYYHPITGGEEKKGWPFGGPIYISEAYRIIASIEGVLHVKELELHLDGKKQSHCEDIPIPEHYLVYSDGHDITVSYRRDNGARA